MKSRGNDGDSSAWSERHGTSPLAVDDMSKAVIEVLSRLPRIAVHILDLRLQGKAPAEIALALDMSRLVINRYLTIISSTLENTTLIDDNHNYSLYSYNRTDHILSNADNPQPVLATCLTSEPSPSKDSHQEYLAALLATVPKDAGYDVLAQGLEGLIGGIRQQVAVTLLPALKAEMLHPSHKSATYDDKKELVKWTNAELRRFDLAIKHPKTGQAAVFTAHPGNHPTIGSFQLSGKDAADGKEKTFTTPELATLLEKLELMEAPPRREALAEWNQKVGRQQRGAKRG